MSSGSTLALSAVEAEAPSLHHVSRAPSFPRVQSVVEALAAAVLAVDVVVVFASVIFHNRPDGSYV